MAHQGQKARRFGRKGSHPHGVKWRVHPSVQGGPSSPWSAHVSRFLTALEGRSNWRSYVLTTLTVAVLTVLLWELRHVIGNVNIALLYVLPVLISALAWGLSSSFYAAGLSILVFDFLFVPPIFSFAVSNVRYVISFAVFLLVGAVTATLASSFRGQYHEALRRESHTQTLYQVTRQMASHSHLSAMLKDLVQHIEATLSLPVVIALTYEKGVPEIFGATSDEFLINHDVLKWVKDHGAETTFGEHHSPELLYIPLRSENATYGVLCLGQVGHALLIDEESFRLVQSLAELTAVAIFQHKAAEEAKLAVLSFESERLRTALLDSISHELMTPLAAVMGSVTALLDRDIALSTVDKSELLHTIREGATRMQRLVTNLLGMVRIEGGMIQLNQQDTDLSDIIGVALQQLEDALSDRHVVVVIPDNLPSLWMDAILMEQALVNILSNAEKYSFKDTPIEIEVQHHMDTLQLTISDYGIGMTAYDRSHVFDKFYRSESVRHIPGTGLGLAISKTIVEAHGGMIMMESHEPKGSRVVITWPDQMITHRVKGDPYE